MRARVPKQKGHPKVAVLLPKCNYAISLFRSIPSAPRMPVPNNITLDGSGTVDSEEVDVRSSEPVFIRSGPAAKFAGRYPPTSPLGPLVLRIHRFVREQTGPPRYPTAVVIPILKSKMFPAGLSDSKI
jgi:hypothetical protein